MTKSAHMRTKIAGLLAIVILSAATMLWLFWRHPISTGIATLAVLAWFGVSARLARSDIDMSDMEQGKQGA